MTLTASFLVYATLYRVAIVAVGALAIVLGYRLFLRGMGDGRPDAGTGTQASLEGGGLKLALGNAAPGTCFALFGAALVVAMVIQGSPELVSNTADAAAGSGASSQISLKGEDRLDVGGGASASPLRDADAATLDSYRAVLSSPESAVGDVADAIAGVARLYLAQGRSLEALTLARLAVQMDGGDPHKLQALAAAALAVGLPEEAAAADRRATALHSGAR